jgi:sugar phosphate isomerase/epimerase
MARLLLLAWALALVPPGVARAETRKHWEVGCRDGGYLRGMGLEDVWAAMDAIGISRVEVRVAEDLSCPGLFENGSTPYRMDTPEAREKLRRKLTEKKKSIAAFCAVVRLEKGKSDEGNLRWIAKIAEAAVDLDRPVIMIPVGGSGFSDEEFVKRAIAFVKELVPIAERHGVQITLENLGHYWNRREILEPVLKAVPPDRVGLALDITNMYWFGHPLSKLYDLAEALAPYVRYVHVKNVNYPTDKREVQRAEGWEYGRYACPVREGDVDFRKIVTLLSKAGYRGDLTLEDDSLGKFDAAGRKKVLQDDVQFLRQIIAEMK